MSAIDLAAKQETRGLTLSLYASILIGVLGIGWGILGDSRIVLFDGVYTLFGTALSGLSLLAAWVASRDATEAYPFGREAIIPVAIVMQRCGRSEAAWQPQRRELVVCYELLDTFYRMSAM